MTKPRTTIHDVARTARVSPSTISNFLNGRPDRMSEETRERVTRAISELGYSPNQLARGLKLGYLPTIGLIVPSVANPFWGAFARFVEHAAVARGCQVLLGNGERDPNRERQYAESLLARGIRGVILGSAPLSLDHLMNLVPRGLHVVTFDREPTERDRYEFDSVRVDNAGGARLAVDHLASLGHRRIGFVSGPINSMSRRDRLDEYRRRLQAHRLSVDPLLVSTDLDADEDGTAAGKTAAMTLLRRRRPPTALFAVNDMIALGIYAGVRELGLEIPQDVSVVGFDDISLCEVVTPPLTTVRQPLDELMQSAVGLLLDRLEGKRTGPATHVTLPAKLVLRGSTAAPR